MAYTPINWQTGDTITAEKLNKMDNGWGIESTPLFSETVTTVAGNLGNSAKLAYSDWIRDDTIIINFDGTDYTCEKIRINGNIWGYGGAGAEALDFTEYPFALTSVRNSGSTLYTETAGTHTISASTASIETSSSFDSAVVLGGVFEVVQGTTTFQEACDAFKSGKHVYVVDNSSSGKTCHMPVIFVNENAFEIKFIATSNNDTALMLTGIAASSADGVLE